jgi:hypothetical protein
VSLNRIRSLVGGAQHLLAEAELEPVPGRVRKLQAEAKKLLGQADEVAEKTKPGITHLTFGYGVIVGVGPEGHLDITFGGDPFAVAIPIDDVEPAP